MHTDHHITEDEHARWFAGAMRGETKRYWIIELAAGPEAVAEITGR
jgi:hypothetical protein